MDVQSVIINQLGEEWRSIFLINLETEATRIIRSRFSSNSGSISMPFQKVMSHISDKFVHPLDREYFNQQLNIATVRKEGLKENNIRRISVRILNNGEYRYVEIQIMTMDTNGEGRYVIVSEKDVHELQMYKLAARENNAVIDALCREYHSIFVIRYNTDTFSVMHMPERYENIIRRNYSYESGLIEYCNEIVCDKDRERIKHFGSLENIAAKLLEQSTIETTYQTVDYNWMAARYIEITSGTSTKERTFLLGIVKYDREMLEEQKTRRANEIITSLTESYQVIYRVNVITGEFEIILMNFENREFVDGFKDFFELEEYYKEHGVEKEFVSDIFTPLSNNMIKEHFMNSSESIEAFYKEKTGRWLKLVISPEKNYSNEYPYIIYAIKEAKEQIENKTRSIINTTAISKMYVLAMTIDMEAGIYECIHCDTKSELKLGKGRLSKFILLMKKLIYEEDFDTFKTLLYETNADTIGFNEREYRAEDEKGMVHFMNAFATYIYVPEGGRILLLVRNIDERAANRARIKSLNKDYDMARNMLYALGNSYFGIYYCNLESQQMIATRQGNDVKSIFRAEYKFDKVMKKYIAEKVLPEDRSKVTTFVQLDSIKKQLTNEGSMIFCEYQRSFADVFRWVRMELQAVKCSCGQAVEIILAFKDIHSEREAELRHKKELREALIAAELASEAKTQFLSNMSHDIRTPMNAVMGMTDIAIAHINDKEKVKSCLNKIDGASKHLLRLINEVLDMSYIESGKTVLNESNFLLSELMHSVVTLTQDQVKQKKQTFKASAINIRNEQVKGDRVRINQILINVVGNAIKYTPEGGTIFVSIEQKPDISKDYSEYIFTVKDNGIGMSEDFVRRIFQPFERENDSTVSKVEGTGLGMTITRNLVEMMKGDIKVVSEPEKGSEFIITIPLKHLGQNRPQPDNLNELYNIIFYETYQTDLVPMIKEASAKDSRPVVVVGSYDITEFEREAKQAGMVWYITEPAFPSDFRKLSRDMCRTGEIIAENKKTTYDFTGKVFLIVDDNAINCDIACDYLEDVGASTETAANGQEAVDKVASGKIYDAILMDVRMPVLNGYEATTRIRKLGIESAEKVPIIAMTANAFTEDVIMSRQVGMNDYITKPIEVTILYSVIAKALSHISD